MSALPAFAQTTAVSSPAETPSAQTITVTEKDLIDFERVQNKLTLAESQNKSLNALLDSARAQIADYDRLVVSLKEQIGGLNASGAQLRLAILNNEQAIALLRSQIVDYTSELVGARNKIHSLRSREKWIALGASAVGLSAGYYLGNRAPSLTFALPSPAR